MGLWCTEIKMMELSKDYVEIIQERYWNYRDKEQRRLI